MTLHLKLHVTFPSGKITEPILHNLSHEFNIVTNIRKADVKEGMGWVDLELIGDSDEIEKACESLKKQGVQVDPIERSVLE